MLLSHWQTYDHYGYALIALIGTALAVALTYWLLAYSRWTGFARSLRGVAPPFINIVGVLFGLMLAFLANDTWSAHDRAMNTVFKEADALRSLDVLSSPLAEPLRTRIRGAIRDYGLASADEWPLLALRRDSPAVSERSDALLTLLASREIAAHTSDNVQALMLRKAADIRDEHDQRIALSRTHVNPLKWLGMAFLGLLTLLSVAVVHVENPRAALAALLLFSLAAAPTAAIVLVQGNPFQQPTAVTPEPIRIAVAAL